MARRGDIREKAERFLRILMPSLGLSFLWPYFRASYLSFLTAFEVQTPDVIQACYVAYVVGFFAIATGVAVFSRRAEELLRGAPARYGLAVCGVLGAALLWFADGSKGAALCVAGAVVSSVFFLGTLARYGLALAEWDARETAIVGFISLGLCFVDNAALALGSAVSMAFCLLMPVVSVVCMPCMPALDAGAAKGTAAETGAPVVGNAPAAGSASAVARRNPSNRALFILMVLLALFCIGGNVVRGITSPWFSYSGVTMRSLYMTLANIVLAGVVIALLCRGMGVRRVLFLSWMLFMGLFFVGLAALAFTGGTLARFGSDIATVSRVFFTLLMFLFALDARRLVDMGVLRLMGLFVLLPEALAAFMRHIVVPALLASLGADPLAIASFAGVVVTFVLAVAIMFVLGALLLGQVDEGRSAAEGEAAEGALGLTAGGVAGVPGSAPDSVSVPAPGGASVPAPDPLSAPMARLAEMYGLTAREVESATCVARGYSLEKTASVLGISINTVRTHMRSVYGKLEVHSRQELIDLVEGLRE